MARPRVIKSIPQASGNTTFSVFVAEYLLDLIVNNKDMKVITTYILDTLKYGKDGLIYYREEDDDGKLSLGRISYNAFFARFPFFRKYRSNTFDCCWSGLEVICAANKPLCQNYGPRRFINISEESPYSYALDPNFFIAHDYTNIIQTILMSVCNQNQRVVDYICTWYWGIISGLKHQVALVLAGKENVGKSTIASAFSYLLPKNYSTTLKKSDFGLFNSKIANKFYCSYEELEADLPSSYYDSIKNCITDLTISMTSVGKDSVDITNRANFCFTSNNDVTYLAGRKFCHIFVPEPQLEENFAPHYKYVCKLMSSGELITNPAEKVQQRYIMESFIRYLSRYENCVLGEIPPECKVEGYSTAPLPCKPTTLPATDVMNLYLADKYGYILNDHYHANTLKGLIFLHIPLKSFKDEFVGYYRNYVRMYEGYPKLFDNEIQDQFKIYLASVGFTEVKNVTMFYRIQTTIPYEYLHANMKDCQEKRDLSRIAKYCEISHNPVFNQSLLAENEMESLPTFSQRNISFSITNHDHSLQSGTPVELGSLMSYLAFPDGSTT